MADLLRAANVLPEFRAAIDLHLIEMSPKLAEIQRSTLASTEPKWHSNLSTLPNGPLIAIANEFVDALPIDQFVKADDGWHERKVGIRDDRLAFALDPAAIRVGDAQSSGDARVQAGAVFERRDPRIVHDLAHRIATQGGAALIVDYGHVRSGFGDTLQAVRAHRVADPLESPGEADLTSHVDFEELAATAIQAGVDALGPVTQGDFLRVLGLELRAENLKRGNDAGVAQLVDEAVARLAGPSPGMGELFKVLALIHPSLPAPPGFDT
jgi:SAM-dependent MidA family methyltransferase